MVIILSKLFGYGYFTFIFIGFMFWFMYTCLKALCNTGTNQSNHFSTAEISMETDNFSSNESF